jgi:hypothetical protein
MLSLPVSEPLLVLELAPVLDAVLVVCEAVVL